MGNNSDYVDYITSQSLRKSGHFFDKISFGGGTKIEKSQSLRKSGHFFDWSATQDYKELSASQSLRKSGHFFDLYHVPFGICKFEVSIPS